MASTLGVVIVHGALHTPAHFDNVIRKLEAEGYVVEAPALPSVGNVAVEDVYAKDVAAIKQAIRKITDTGKNVVLIMHSYGGTVGSDALAEVQEEAKASADQSQGRIVHALYIAAVLLDKGTDLASQRKTAHEVDFKDGLIIHLNPVYRFYNTTAPDVAQKAAELMLPHSAESMATPTRYRGWADYDIPLTYIACLQDHSYQESETESYLQRLEDAKLTDYTKVEIDCDHSPWVSSGQDEFFETLARVLQKASKA